MPKAPGRATSWNCRTTRASWARGGCCCSRPKAGPGSIRWRMGACGRGWVCLPYPTGSAGSASKAGISARSCIPTTTAADSCPAMPGLPPRTACAFRSTGTWCFASFRRRNGARRMRARLGRCPRGKRNRSTTPSWTSGADACWAICRIRVPARKSAGNWRRAAPAPRPSGRRRRKRPPGRRRSRISSTSFRCWAATPRRIAWWRRSRWICPRWRRTACPSAGAAPRPPRSARTARCSGRKPAGPSPRNWWPSWTTATPPRKRR